MNWTKTKPTSPGVYGIRGFQYGRSVRDQYEAIVTVRLFENDLVVNLHRETSNDQFEDWYLVDDLDEDFEWLKFVPESNDD